MFLELLTRYCVQVDEDQDGFISYREFARFAYDLLQKLTSLRLLETEMEQDQFAQYARIVEIPHRAAYL